MQISRVQIKKFRSIKEYDIETDQLCAIVGQNGAGKSTILRALNAFFNLHEELADFDSGSHAYARASSSEIIVWFKDIPSRLKDYAPEDDCIGIRLRYKRQSSWAVWNGDEWGAADEEILDEVHRSITYTYVPLDRSHQQAEWYEGGLLDAVVTEEITRYVQRDHVSGKIGEAARHLRGRSLDPLASNLRDFTPLRSDFRFSFEYTENPGYRLLLNNLTISIEENGKTIPLKDTGSGTQSLTVFALYSYLSGINGKSYIVGFEEPEQNLHPQAQVNLIGELKDSGLQVLFTTHSPMILDELDHEDVVLCRKIPSRTRAVETTVRQISSNFFSDHGLDREKYYKFHRRENSEFFFSDFVALFESLIDAAVVDRIMEDSNISLRHNGVKLMSVGGKTSLPYMFFLLRELNIDSIAVVDKDYFFKFINGAREQSLNTRGYPVYDQKWHLDGILKEEDIEPSDRQILERELLKDHTHAISILEKYHVYCFRTDMECDLVGSRKIREALAVQLGIDLKSVADLETELLRNYKNAIKKQENLLPAISGIGAKSLPRTFQALRRRLSSLVND